MRFGIRDLFLTVTLVAIYAAMAGAGLFGTLDRAMEIAPITVIALIAVVGCCWLLCGRFPSGGGDTFVSLRLCHGWRLHGWVAATTLAVALTYRWIESDGRGGPLQQVMPQVLVQSYLVLYFSSRVALCEHGVAVGWKLLPYGQHRFTIENTAASAVLVVDGGRGPMSVRFSTIAIPPEDIDKVRAILAEKQSTTDGTNRTVNS